MKQVRRANERVFQAIEATDDPAMLRKIARVMSDDNERLRAMLAEA